LYNNDRDHPAVAALTQARERRMAQSRQAAEADQ
jgi:hypothetical protein